jgi:hypothetical protein
VNYLKELNAFRDWSMINRPSTGQIALWYTLMSINNMTGWKEWFTVPNQTLQLMTGLSRQGLDKARNGLIQSGLIQYKKGRSNQAGSYKMNSLLGECQKVGTEVVAEVDTGVGKEVGTPAAYELAHQQRSGSTLFKQKETKREEDVWLDDWEHVPEDPDLKQIRDLFIKRSQRFPNGDDLSLMSDLLVDQIPLETILDGINFAFDNYQPKFKGDSITRFSYCNKVIRSIHQKKQEWKSANKQRRDNHAKGNEEHRGTSGADQKESITGGKVGWLAKDRVLSKQAKA